MKTNSLNIIQLEELIKIEKMSDEKIIHELLEIFNEQINNFMQTSSSLLENKNFEELSKVAHKLKSSAGNLGLNRIYELFLDLETSAKYLKSEQCGICITNMPNLYKSSIEELKIFLSSAHH